MIDPNATHTGKTAHSPLTERVLQFMDIMEGLVERGKTSADVIPADWDALATLVDVNHFQRIGPFHDALNWRDYTAMLTEWVNHSEGWHPVVKRISEAPGVVYCQCEEMITQGDRVFPFY
ncbi:MAG: hypothetical protein LUO80_02815, partial [Methylococcaceae bacterium]|nr:hypothetical protein [Methylococcaceae bacterium]